MLGHANVATMISGVEVAGTAVNCCETTEFFL